MMFGSLATDVAAGVGAGEPAGTTVGAGVAAGVDCGVAGGVDCGAIVAVSVGALTGVGVVAVVSVALVVGAGDVRLPTLKVEVVTVVDELVTIRAVKLWRPGVTAAEFHALAAPAEVEPTKSKGARTSTWVGDPARFGLSSQKLTLVTPPVGVRKM
jgi:hypothetical protein